MRSVRKVAACGLITVALIAGSAGIAAAEHSDGLGTGDHTGGGGDGDSIFASAGAFGGSSKGGRFCGWKQAWPDSNGSTSLVDIGMGLSGRVFNPFGFGLADLIKLIFGDDVDPSKVRVYTAEEAEQAKAAAEASGKDITIYQQVLGEGELDHVEVIEGYDDFGATLGLILSGPHELGELEADPNASADPTKLTDEQREGKFYVKNESYPMIQRGTDPVTGEELWWDPWYVSVQASQDHGCPAGLIYSPRTSNSGILLPDVLSVVTKQLPSVKPVLIPLDKSEGWAYVQVPTNFAVAPSSLEDKYAHAEVEYIPPGGGASQSVWAQVHAIPVGIVFDPGDGSAPIQCSVTEAYPYDPTNPGPCSHTYLDSSNTAPGGTFQTRVTVLWTGLYTSSSFPGVQTVDIAPTTSTFNISVAEARVAVAE